MKSNVRLVRGRLCRPRLGANVGACDGRGLGGLSNAKHAKADQLYRVPRDNAHKDNGSCEDTEPPPGTSTLLAAVPSTLMFVVLFLLFVKSFEMFFSQSVH